MRGRSSDLVKEAARVEKIRASMREYAKNRVRNAETGQWGKKSLGVSFGFVRVGRETGDHRNGRLGWSYDFIEPEDVGEYGIDDVEALRKHLEEEAARKGHPRRYWVVSRE